MNFVPVIPQATQQSQGMNYGDWQQYAGFNRANPFGGTGGLYGNTGGIKPVAPTKVAAVPAPVRDLTPFATPDQTTPAPIATTDPLTQGGMNTPSTDAGTSVDFDALAKNMGVAN